MGFIRRHLLACTWLWLLGQAASVSALAPRDCCDAHHLRAATGTPLCHEAAPGAECPMRDADGQPCPMHRATAKVPTPAPPAAPASAHDHGNPTDPATVATPAHDHAVHAAAPSAPTPSATAPSAPAATDNNADTRCRMRGSCDGPVSVLGALFWIPGIVATSAADAVDAGTRTTPPAAARLPVTLGTLDTPPPRLQS